MKNSLFLLLAVLAIQTSLASAEDRTIEEFQEYASRRLGKVDQELLVAFVERVDADGDGTISGEEFSGRIAAFQQTFKALPSAPHKSHGLPENWLTDFKEAQKESVSSGKPIVAMFSASWCGPCKAMIARVFPTDEAKEALDDFVPVYIDSEKERELAAKYEIRAFPTFVCINAKDAEVERHVGGGDVAKFAGVLEDFGAAASKLAKESDSE